MPTKPKKKARKPANIKSGRQNPKAYTAPARLQQIFAALDQLFPHAECALKHENAFQLLVATILSAQCTDERVNKVTPELFRKYPTPQDFVGLAPAELEKEIRSTGFFRNKAKSIIGAATKIVQDFGGEVPRTMEQLLPLPGVARKTANVVLGTAFGIAETHEYTEMEHFSSFKEAAEVYLTGAASWKGVGEFPSSHYYDLTLHRSHTMAYPSYIYEEYRHFNIYWQHCE